MTNVADYAMLIIVATSVITLNKNLMTHKWAFYMSNVKHTITDSEYSIMKILWGSENKMTVSDVVKALDGNGWTPSTVSTFLQRLLKKNVVSCEKRETQTYITRFSNKMIMICPRRRAFYQRYIKARLKILLRHSMRTKSFPKRICRSLKVSLIWSDKFV